MMSVCLFKHSNVCPRMLVIHSKRPKFQNFFPETHPFVVSFFLLHLLQSFCQLLKILEPWVGVGAGLSKVAGCRQKSLPTWLVLASYSAWHFFMDCIF